MQNRMIRCAFLGSLLLALANGISASAQSTNPSTAQAGSATCIVEYRKRGKKPVEVQAPLTEATTIQQVLNQTKSARKFSRMEIAVARKSADSHRMQYFKVPYDKRKKAVSMLHDYALRPGDRVVVVENNTSILTDLFSDMASSAGGILGMHNKRK